jgi:hypothetical protein
MNFHPPSRRVDPAGRAFKGSQRQLQTYVNERTDELNAAIRAAIPGFVGARIDWRSPLADDSYREYRDGAFLAALGDNAAARDLHSFWPKGGPVWDGLATASLETGVRGLLLVEAKSYPAEMSSACRATPKSRELIERSLATTRTALGARGKSDSWTRTYYQLANRIAHVHWLRSLGREAWLVLICFTDDADHVATTADEWEAALANAKRTMGLGAKPDRLVEILVPAVRL